MCGRHAITPKGHPLRPQSTKSISQSVRHHKHCFSFCTWYENFEVLRFGRKVWEVVCLLTEICERCRDEHLRACITLVMEPQLRRPFWLRMGGRGSVMVKHQCYHGISTSHELAPWLRSWDRVWQSLIRAQLMKVQAISQLDYHLVGGGDLIN